MTEVDKEPAPVFAVLVQPVVARLDLRPIQKPQHRLLQRARSLARNDLYLRGMLRDRLFDDVLQCLFDALRIAEYRVQVQFKFHRRVAAGGISPG